MSSSVNKKSMIVIGDCKIITLRLHKSQGGGHHLIKVEGGTTLRFLPGAEQQLKMLPGADEKSRL